ncbi:MAG: haloalkane dehalogenase [Methanoregula sp.]|nr:haloalkane dehalogenase [Methanoregula sp.]
MNETINLEHCLLNPQQNISTDFPYESQFISFNNTKMHYIEAGTYDPPVLLIQGIPTHSYLWRNVIPHISPYARTIAIDLIGFGKSDKPTDIEYNLPRYTRFLEGAIEALDLKNVTIVAMDLGLIVGLNYAMNHEENIRGLVLFEGFFQPMDVAYKKLPFINRFSLRLMKIQKHAEHMIVYNGEKMVEQMISTTTVRKLTPEEITQYQIPLRDEAVRKKVWLEGIGPTIIKPESEQPGDIVDLINRYADALSKSQIPKLLLYADPGMVVSKKTAESAQKVIPNLEIKYVGTGKHFLPEDQPDAIGQSVADFYRGVR